MELPRAESVESGRKFVGATPKPDRQRLLPFGRPPSWLAVLGVVAIATVALIATYVVDQAPLSPFDEWVYIDYVDKSTHFNMLQQGEALGDEALEISSCRGVYVWGTAGSPCGGPYDPATYPLRGITSADFHPPTYFFGTAAGAAIIRFVGFSNDLLTSSRLMGAVWLIVGLAVMSAAARSLGSAWGSVLGMSLVVATLPLIRWTNSYVTPDAANVLVGSVTMLAGVKCARGQWKWWFAALAGALAGAFKIQMGLAVGAAALFLLLTAIAANGEEHGPDRGRRNLMSAGAMAAGFLVAQFTWLFVRSWLSLGAGPTDTASIGLPLSFNLIARESTAFVFGLALTGPGPPPVYAYYSAALLVGGCVGAVLYRGVRTEIWRLAASVSVMLVVGSPLLLLAEYGSAGEVIRSPERYGGSLIAGMAVVTSTSFVGRWRTAAVGVFGIALGGVVLIDNLAR